VTRTRTWWLLGTVAAVVLSVVATLATVVVWREDRGR